MGLVSYPNFPSRYIGPRQVDVWLPSGFDEHSELRYPVLYMHDGQNLFNPSIAFTGIDWGVDEALERLEQAKKIPPVIVVAIWNTAGRRSEYMPEKAALLLNPAEKAVLYEDYGIPNSDAYLRYLVEEIKPFIDRVYLTLSDQQHTYIMGSSMGGLVSLYALMEYPQVFSGAGCLSTHWPAGDGVVIRYMNDHLPDPASHRLYFDYGSETLDALYHPYQSEVDWLLHTAGYVPGKNLLSLYFPGAEHAERAWRERLDIPLEFLLGPLLDGKKSST